jgi:hypothetical protein
MANIKFSDFTVGNTEGDIDFVVGYKGASNIQISPTNLLASALGNYLPLAGGTMTGDVKFNDNVKARFGTGLDAYIQHDSSNTEIINATGNLNIKNSALDGDIIFYSDDGNGGVSEYFKLDGSRASGSYTYTTRPDGGVITFGDGLDLRLWHDPNTNKSYMRSYNNDLYIESITADKDILFRADDGSGGVQTYFYLDGGKVDGSNILGATVFPDKSKIYVGSSYDLEIFHNGVDDTWIDNINGNLNIRNQQNSGDIIFRCDNGNGGVAEYFSLDGGNVRLNAKVNLRIYDAKKLQLGNSGDLEIYHNNSTDNANIDNNTGDLYVSQYTNDGDIIFRSDDGSGGIAQYFRVDGGEVETRFLKSTLHFDNVKAKFGDGGDLEIYHNGVESVIANETGNFYISQKSNNSDIIFENDDGSGGLATYFTLDGSLTQMWADKDIQFSDNIKAKFGASSDLQIYHGGTNSVIDNLTGDLIVTNFQDDGDIKFLSDNGSGGTTEYFIVDGTNHRVKFSKDSVHTDNVKVLFGDSLDLQIYHDGNNSSYITSTTSDIYLRNEGNNDKTYIQATNNGTIYNYITIDGSADRAVFSRSTRHNDNVVSTFGTSEDLQIYHDGSNSYIKDGGTGDLRIWADSPNISTASGNKIFFGNNGAAELYYTGGVKKFETTSTGIKITGVSEYADNTAALAGGLTTGDVYRTGDLLKIVH